MYGFNLPVLLTVISVVSCSQHGGFKVRWGNPYNAYYDLPWTLSEALDTTNTLWRLADYDHGLGVHMISHDQDPRFFLLFDQKGTVAGVRFSFDRDDVNRKMFVHSEHIFTFPNEMFSTGKVWEKSVWFNSVIFTHPDVIKSGGRPNLNKETDDVVSSLYYWADSQWRPVSKSECDVTSDLIEQGCYKGMGKHYYYRTDQGTSCAEWQGVFVTYDQGRLSGFGVSVFGSFVSTYFTPTYYEYPDFSVVKQVLSNRPSCVDDWLPYTGVTSVHVFITEDAAQLTCPQPDWRTTHCPQDTVAPETILV